MRQGYRNRTTFATNMNEHSSRSHCMLSVYVSGTNRVTGQVARGKLHLVDLAGERGGEGKGPVMGGQVGRPTSSRLPACLPA